ncbi:MAG: hypothetical protein ABR566_11165 [Pyrinomonadaceae bacterium]
MINENMNFQTIIVAIIILLALLYAGKIILGKVKAFSLKSSCSSDCGCAVRDKR